MSLNSRAQIENEKRLTHVLVGSHQALYARRHRSIYAPAKAFGLDFCTALAEGHEVSRCFYIAPGPIDTPMLHRNYWVIRAHGSEQFFNWMLGRPRMEYKKIFLDCDELLLDRLVAIEFLSIASEIKATMPRYRRFRDVANRSSLGILGPDTGAESIRRIVMSADAKSGIYGLRNDPKTGPVIEYAPFSSLSRSVLFEQTKSIVAP